MDNLTSEICSELDGKVFDTKDAQVDKNYPPMHPNCRSTTIPYTGDDRVSEELKDRSKDNGELTYENVDVPDFMKNRKAKDSIEPIYNGDEVVNKYYDKLIFKTDNSIIHERVRQSIRMMPEQDLMLLNRIKIIIEEDTVLRGGSARQALKFNDKTIIKPRIMINPNSNNSAVFAHEFAHIVANENDLFNNYEYINIVNNSMKNARLDEINIRGIDYVALKSDKFVRDYQGRTYIKLDDYKGEIDIKDLREFISVGYEYFVKEPKKLYNVNKELYNFILKGGLRNGK